MSAALRIHILTCSSCTLAVKCSPSMISYTLNTNVDTRMVDFSIISLHSEFDQEPWTVNFSLKEHAQGQLLHNIKVSNLPSPNSLNGHFQPENLPSPLLPSPQTSNPRHRIFHPHRTHPPSTTIFPSSLPRQLHLNMPMQIN